MQVARVLLRTRWVSLCREPASVGLRTRIFGAVVAGLLALPSGAASPPLTRSPSVVAARCVWRGLPVHLRLEQPRGRGRAGHVGGAAACTRTAVLAARSTPPTMSLCTDDVVREEQEDAM
jgi:hypothetical protein